MFEKTTELLNRYADILVSTYKDRLDSEGITASGGLKNSVKYIIDMTDTKLELSLSLLDYWYYVDNGRKAGTFPPVDKILDWIKIKPIIPEPINGRLPTENQLAYLIGRKIEEKGIEPKHTLSNSIDDAFDNGFMKELENAITEDISNLIDRELLILIQ